jgi:hypothetical protein
MRAADAIRYWFRACGDLEFAATPRAFTDIDNGCLADQRARFAERTGAHDNTFEYQVNKSGVPINAS